jgi:predicted O-methyltransferase YrrM
VTLVNRAIRRAKRAAGYETRTVIAQLAERDARWTTFCRAAEYINFEGVPGDIVEFGVYTGISLALLAYAHSFDPKGMNRRIAGFDSFEGLPDSGETHARWQAGLCGVNHSWHPLLRDGEPVTPEVTRRLFQACGFDEPLLYVGPFDETLPAAFPTAHTHVSLVHFDCDLYESTRDVLAAIAPALQDGTLLLFDDWFHYKGHPRKGEARAFAEFLSAHPEWGAVQYQPYATFCNSFILHRR